MNDLKIGDKVKIKKLSKKEFEEIYYKIYSNFYMNYDKYLNTYEDCFNKIFEIKKIDSLISCREHFRHFYKEEVKKINYLGIKYKIIKELLKNE